MGITLNLKQSRYYTVLRNCWYGSLHKWLGPVINPVFAIRGLKEYLRYFSQWREYARFPGAEDIRLGDAYPCLHDRTATTPFDAHYFYVNGWAMRRIVANSPKKHIDVGSQTIFANLLGAVVSTTFVDYRPLDAKIEGLHCIAGDILQLPFADNTIESLSCLHVAEHIGLGRYGDPLDPLGTEKAAKQLSRVLAPGGNLYFALPVGKPRLCFNAHRIHATETILEYFADLELVELSGVHDDDRFVERVEVTEFKDSSYACGMFWFRKSQSL